MAAPGIRAVLLHETALFVEDASGQIQLRPDADRLLYRLRFSKLLVGVSTVSVPLSLEQDALLKSAGSLEFLKPVVLDNDHPELALESLLKTWEVPSKSCIFFSASRDELFKKRIEECGWNIVYLLSGCGLFRATCKQFSSMNKMLSCKKHWRHCWTFLISPFEAFIREFIFTLHISMK